MEKILLQTSMVLLPLYSRHKLFETHVIGTLAKNNLNNYHHIVSCICITNCIILLDNNKKLVKQLSIQRIINNTFWDCLYNCGIYFFY